MPVEQSSPLCTRIPAGNVLPALTTQFKNVWGIDFVSVRSKGISAAIAFAMAGVMCGVGTQAANAVDMQPRGVGANEICTVIGIGSGAAGLSKALAKGASWVGIGASIGCYAYSKAKEVTPAQQRAGMIKSYNDFQAKSDLGKLDALGYYCRKKSSGGGGGGGDFTTPRIAKIGYRDIKMKGVTYSCTATGD
ncbi:hypothetical protein [Streptomyces sp. NPDC007205]|uniref:hypothetical protein n=1 Tax=Streptomyces sp. NPDC007205 TaxID=3154316 RepID=UPI00340F81F4